jgi:co-chaperonin GroES (HSP10)
MDSKTLNLLNLTHIAPTSGRLLIKRIPLEVKTESGLIISTGRKVNQQGGLEEIEDVADEENTFYADVLAVGPDLPANYVGSRVMSSKHSGIELKKGTGILLIREADILAFVA